MKFCHYFLKKHSKKGYAAIKLDLEKPYETGLGFYQKVTDLDFYDRWINGVIQCMTTTNFKVAMNGNIGNLIYP